MNKSIKSVLRGTWIVAAAFQLHNAAANPTVVNLGTDANFAILAGSGITLNGPNTISGDIGTYPTQTTPSGLAGVTFLTGANQTANTPVMTTAKSDLTTAFTAAQGISPTMSYGAVDLGGDTLLPGVYSASSTIGITGTLTLNAAGNPNAVWIFQAGSALTTAAGSSGAPLSSVVLENGAQAGNVFWVVGTMATLGTYSDFVGNLLASTSITADTGATVDGRLLAENGAVTLNSDTITAPPVPSTGSGGGSGGAGVPDAGSTLALVAFGLVALSAFGSRPRFLNKKLIPEINS